MADMSQTTFAIEVEGLTKRYGTRAAVDDLTFAVPHGVVAGFIGPNGAGKTTTMAMLLGLVRPTSGRGTVLGEPVGRPERYLARVGALIEAPALWPALTARENLRVLCRLGGHAPAGIPAALDLVGLAGASDHRFGTFSFGMKQRLAIAAALLGDPSLLVLDEPTNGLDPVGMSEMRDLVRRLAREDRTVLVSSHLLSELEQVCDWLVIIERGRLAYCGERAAFGRESEDEIVLAPADLAQLPALAEVLRSRRLEPARRREDLVVTVDGGEARRLAAELNHHAASVGIVLAELHVRRPTLESSYLRVIEGSTP